MGQKQSKTSVEKSAVEQNLNITPLYNLERSKFISDLNTKVPQLQRHLEPKLPPELKLDLRDIENKFMAGFNALIKEHDDFITENWNRFFFPEEVLRTDIQAITKPLYAKDADGYPCWQTQPLANAEMLSKKIKELYLKIPAVRNSKLIQELHGLQYLCLAHHCYNIYLFANEQNKSKEALNSFIEFLKIAEVMGYHNETVYESARHAIEDAKTAHDRQLLDSSLPGGNERINQASNNRSLCKK